MVSIAIRTVGSCRCRSLCLLGHNGHILGLLLRSKYWQLTFILSQQVLYFLLSTLVLTLYIDVVLSLSIYLNWGYKVLFLYCRSNFHFIRNCLGFHWENLDESTDNLSLGHPLHLHYTWWFDFVCNCVISPTSISANSLHLLTHRE